jgi:ADP-ribosylglycohydrolase
VAEAARRTHGSGLSELDRALGALYGLAIGDALGMPAQEMAPDRAQAILGTPPDFRDGPEDNPISRGLPAGTITDDTMQCLLLAEQLIAGNGQLDHMAFAEALIAWQEDMADRGRGDLLGPTTRRALAALVAGEDPSRTGRGGTTNGAAMRVTPVGIANTLDRLHNAVVAADRLTHDTAVAHAGAAVVATIVSAGIDGATFDEAAPLAIRAARQFGFADLYERPGSFATGAETAESVPTAFAIARIADGNVWRACTGAVALGGDTDTIAAMAGAMVGACTGLARLPPDAVRKVREVNHIDLEPIARGLLDLRER